MTGAALVHEIDRFRHTATVGDSPYSAKINRMGRRNVLTLEPQDPEFIAAAFTDASRNRRMIESRRLDIVIDGRPLRYCWRDWSNASGNKRSR